MDLELIFNNSSDYHDYSTFWGDNIYLKLVSQKDLNFIMKLFSCPDVKKYFVLRDDHQNNLPSFLAFLISRFKAGHGFDFIINDLQDNPVGLITCELERVNENLVGNISYAIHPDFRNKGYAREALHSLCIITNESQLSALKLDISTDNIISERIARTLGFIADKQRPLFDSRRPETGIRFAWYSECYKAPSKRIELSVNAINCFREKNYYKAIDLLRESLKYKNPAGSPHSDAQIYSNLGMALSTTKQYKEAYDYLMKAYNAGLRNKSTLNEIEWLKTNASHLIY